MKKIISLLAFLVVLASCASDSPPPVKLGNDSGAPVNLDVLTVTVIDRSMPPLGNTPYSSNNFQPTLANAMRKWALDKFVAVGTTGEAIVVIRDASLRSDPLHHSDDWFTRQQASKYVGHMEMELDVSGRAGHGQITAESTHFETLPENPTTQERQNAYMLVLNSGMSDLVAQMRQGVREHLGAFVITAPILR